MGEQGTIYLLVLNVARRSIISVSLVEIHHVSLYSTEHFISLVGSIPLASFFKGERGRRLMNIYISVYRGERIVLGSLAVFMVKYVASAAPSLILPRWGRQDAGAATLFAIHMLYGDASRNRHFDRSYLCYLA